MTATADVTAPREAPASTGGPLDVLVAVARSVKTPGAGAWEELGQAPRLEQTTLGDALQHDWDSPAMLVGYGLVDEQGQPAPVAVRINKAALASIEAAGPRVVQRAMTVEFDFRDAHGEKSPLLPEEFAAFEAEIPGLVEVLANKGAAPAAVFTTRNGFRAVHVSREAVEVGDVGPIMLGIATAWRSVGFEADDKALGWNHLQGLPRITREDGTRAADDPNFRVWTFDHWLDVSRVVELAPATATCADRRPLTPAGELIDRDLDDYPEDVQHRFRRCAEEALSTQVARLRSTPRGRRSATLYPIACDLWEFSHAGLLDSAVVEQALYDACEAIDYPGERARGHIERAAAQVAPKDLEALAERLDIDVDDADDTDQDSLPRYPVDDVFPRPIATIARALGERVGDKGCRLSGPVTLGLWSGTTQTHFDVQMGDHDAPMPVGLHVQVIAESSSGKSHTIGRLKKRMSDECARRRKEYDQQRRRYIANMKAVKEVFHRKAKEHLENKSKAEAAYRQQSEKGIFDGVHLALNAKAAAIKMTMEASEACLPEQPKRTDNMLSDVTAEAGLRALGQQAREELIVVCDEGSTFTNLLGTRYGTSPNLDPWHAAFSGTGLGADRIRDGQASNGEPPPITGVYAENPRLVSVQAIQPRKFADVMQKAGDHAIDTGHFGRVLVSIVPPRESFVRFDDRDTLQPIDLVPWEKLVDEGLRRVPPPANKRHVLRLDPEARAVFGRFYDRAQTETLPGGRYSGRHAAWGGRRPEQVLRIAANLAVMWSGFDVRVIDRESVERAIQVLKYHDSMYAAIVAPYIDGTRSEKGPQSSGASPALNEWLAERTKPSAFAEVRADELLAALNEWLEGKGHAPFTDKQLGHALKNKAGKRRQLVAGKKRRFYTGIELISENQQ